ncbi:DUF397 domain-containing protein [Streptomyces acidiscabies]|uniref:DUF397 domain-containing protein n=1 Tax=Streptomyces acidiscabies TaxID=42234 RepID=A0AAP6EJX4_9ACTN|nr:DUF397 domain-containing protein [Streptomyces acidiscabies]MBP5939211.1 DUF397 domain-containing protein [Streptomyces sp. LBUM 1476]MBZ3910332.1 DUF397 domain-containing protein [Streptomyces acidiscabies]MDX2964986.1 DUF397 domain-containing protein [Streptomyces acidiscabies]MDX3024667.1 DUF397 domain-containing protein [Streptomyces acidiscabies]MDX3795998.1 DUF397 domain-containing protein [Streptomyces acidiscabies]
MTEPTWQTSTYSEQGSACVEISTAPSTVSIRDSKSPSRPHLTVSPAAWSGFVSHAAGADSRSFQ